MTESKAQNSSSFFDVIVIGGGPAGLSAMLWCSDLGLSALLLEADGEMGGQLTQIFNPVTNYPGRTTPDGRTMLAAFVDSASDIRGSFRVNSQVARIDPDERSVILVDDSAFNYRALIVATGVRRRRLDILPDVSRFGSGIMGSGSRDGKSLTGSETVVIIGGGDAAFENSIILSSVAKKVYVVHRGPRPRARSDFALAARDLPNVEIVANATPVEIVGTDRVEAVRLRDSVTGALRTVAADRLLIRIGVEPNSSLLRDIAALDGEGYVKVNTLGETSAEWIYAAGDVAHPVSPTIATAVGTGATAVKAIVAAFNSSRH